MDYLRKMAVIFTVLFVLCTVLIYILIRDFHEVEALERIRQALNYESALQQYISTHQKPIVNKLIRQGNLPEGYFEPSLLSSSYISRSIHDSYLKITRENSISDAEVYLKFASDNPTNPANLADPFETKVLNYFRQSGSKEFTKTLTKDGREYIFFAKPYTVNEPKCLQCHSNPDLAPKGMVERYGSKNGFGEKAGHLRAITALYTPLNTLGQQNNVVFLSLELLMLLVFVFIFLLIRYYTRQISQKDQFITQQTKFAAMGEMVGMIAHQWRQPLTGMGMTVDNLKLDIELQTIEEDKWMKNLDQISEQIHYLSHTIDDFRNFFKPNQERQEVYLSKLIHESLQVIQSSIDSNSIEVSVECNENLTLYTFRNDLMQILLNLIKNAQDAYVENSICPRPIEIKVYENQNNVIIQVIDQAGGIPEAIMDKIFDPYFSTKDEKNGTGLGLYMTRMIIMDHFGGNILVSSSKGSTEFEIILPKGH